MLIKASDLSPGQRVFVGGGWFWAEVVAVRRGYMGAEELPAAAIIANPKWIKPGDKCLFVRFTYEPKFYRPGEFEQAVRPDAKVYCPT